MPILQIQHAVRDYESWKRAFDEDPVDRRGGGVRAWRILRPADDPRFVIVELEFGTLEEAESFQARLRRLWGDVDARLGLEDPRTRIVDVVETATL